MQTQHNHLEAGFTLIEVLIVTTVLVCSLAWLCQT
jgi:prepilin-type N-terminal cleavage/methylation domain-containing protein